MKRPAATISAVFLVLLGIAAGVLWERSYRQNATFEFGPNRWERSTIDVGDGAISYTGPHEVNSPMVGQLHFWRLELACTIALLTLIPGIIRRMARPGVVVMLLLTTTICSVIFGGIFFIFFPMALVLFDLVLLVCYLVNQKRADARGFEVVLKSGTGSS